MKIRHLFMLWFLASIPTGTTVVVQSRLVKSIVFYTT